MAELTKLLHFLKSGTEQTAKAYSTADEAGDNYVPFKIDGVACYAPIGATDDAMATNGRVIKGGTTYAIKSQAKPAYTEVSYTTAGTHTFTVPAGVTRMRVAVCGGGGGGCTVLSESHQGTKSGTVGGASYFGSTSMFQATGGGGGQFYGYEEQDDEGWYDTRTLTPGTAGSPNGNAGQTVTVARNATGAMSGGSGFALSFTKSSGSYGTGGGGSAGAKYSKSYLSSGGSGGYKTGYVNVTPNNTYSVVVGSAGSPYFHTGQQTYSYSPVNAKSGFVLIAYGGDI